MTRIRMQQLIPEVRVCESERTLVSGYDLTRQNPNFERSVSVWHSVWLKYRRQFGNTDCSSFRFGVWRHSGAISESAVTDELLLPVTTDVRLTNFSGMWFGRNVPDELTEDSGTAGNVLS